MGKLKKWWHDNWLGIGLFGLKALGTVGMIFGAYAGAKRGVAEAFDINRLEVRLYKSEDGEDEELPVVEVSKF